MSPNYDIQYCQIMAKVTFYQCILTEIAIYSGETMEYMSSLHLSCWFFFFAPQFFKKKMETVESVQGCCKS